MRSLTMSLRWTLAIASCGLASAQVPRDFLLVLEDVDPSTQGTAFHFVERQGAVTAPLRDQRVFLPFNSLAIDPADSTKVYFDNAATSLTGIWELELDGNRFARAVWGTYRSRLTLRLAASDSHVYFLENDDLSRHVKGDPRVEVLLTSPGFTDLTADVTNAYAVDVQGRVFEVDLATRNVRTLGTYPGAVAIDLDGAQGLVLGTTSGDVLRIDRTSGAVLGTQSTGRGIIHAIVADSAGDVFFATAQDVWNAQQLGTPLFTSSRSVLDLDIARRLAAIAAPYGAPCLRGPQASPVWRFPELPGLGNANFTFSMDGGTPSGVASLILGVSNTFDGGTGLNLPFDLTVAGLPGCFLNASLETLTSIALNAQGSVDVLAPIPPFLGLSGAQLFGQWVVLQPVAPFLPAFSSGARFGLR